MNFELEPLDDILIKEPPSRRKNEKTEEPPKQGEASSASEEVSREKRKVPFSKKQAKIAALVAAGSLVIATVVFWAIYNAKQKEYIWGMAQMLLFKEQQLVYELTGLGYTKDARTPIDITQKVRMVDGIGDDALIFWYKAAAGPAGEESLEDIREYLLTIYEKEETVEQILRHPAEDRSAIYSDNSLTEKQLYICKNLIYEYDYVASNLNYIEKVNSKKVILHIAIEKITTPRAPGISSWVEVEMIKTKDGWRLRDTVIAPYWYPVDGEISEGNIFNEEFVLEDYPGEEIAVGKDGVSYTISFRNTALFGQRKDVENEVKLEMDYKNYVCILSVKEETEENAKRARYDMKKQELIQNPFADTDIDVESIMNTMRGILYRCLSEERSFILVGE